MVMTDHDDDGP